MTNRFRRVSNLIPSRLLMLMTALALALVVAPISALARSYDISQVTIDATVGTDGSLTVQEVRQFDFDGSFHGVYWKIPTGSYGDRTIDTSILAVGEMIDGQFVAFEQSTSGDEHTYELSEYSSYVQVKLYSSHEDENAQFVISYKDTNLATRYDDIAELYWKFVSDGWDEESRNVTCTVHLPVPSGAVVKAGDNVRAWGHGPLDANVSFSGNDVLYKVPGVGTSEFAEARITFPAEWLSEASSVGGSKLESILKEEQGWADEANARRNRARVMVYGSSAAAVGIPIVAVVLSIISLLKYRRSHKPQFDDKYFRDVPSDDHPAVLGALLNEGNATDEGLTAALMRLTDEGYMKLDLIKYHKKGLLGREKLVEDYCLTPLKYANELGRETQLDRVDHETMKFLFERLAPKAARYSKRTDVDPDKLFFGDLERVAKKSPERYDDYYTSWQAAVESECDRRGFFYDKKEVGRGWAVAASILCGLVAIGGGFLMFMFDAPVAALIGVPCVGILGALITAYIATKLDPVSEEALEITAKLKALRNWLKDFTRLDEAVPQDVILWNKLLIMAVVLGVADEVIEQLMMVAPQILDDPYMYPVYGWYYYGGPSSPARAFTHSVSEAHSVSSAALAASSDSSGGGGGGGFSGGGGGGFGGGGGGGAF